MEFFSFYLKMILNLTTLKKTNTMRKLLLLSTLILSLAPWRPLEAQKYRKKETSLTSFSLNIDPVCKAKSINSRMYSQNPVMARPTGLLTSSS
jgi:hypothetical protein